MFDFLEFLKTNWLDMIFLVVSITLFLFSVLKSKNKSSKNKLMDLIQAIPQLVIDAEQMFGAGKGSDKLKYVLTELRVLALENKIKVDTQYLTEQINTIVDVSKNVNVDSPIKRDVGTTPNEHNQSIVEDCEKSVENIIL